MPLLCVQLTNTIAKLRNHKKSSSTHHDSCGAQFQTWIIASLLLYFALQSAATGVEGVRKRNASRSEAFEGGTQRVSEHTLDTPHAAGSTGSSSARRRVVELQRRAALRSLNSTASKRRQSISPDVEPFARFHDKLVAELLRLAVLLSTANMVRTSSGVNSTGHGSCTDSLSLRNPVAGTMVSELLRAGHEIRHVDVCSAAAPAGRAAGACSRMLRSADGKETVVRQVNTLAGESARSRHTPTSSTISATSLHEINMSMLRRTTSALSRWNVPALTPSRSNSFARFSVPVFGRAGSDVVTDAGYVAVSIPMYRYFTRHCSIRAGNRTVQFSLCPDTSTECVSGDNDSSYGCRCKTGYYRHQNLGSGPLTIDALLQALSDGEQPAEELHDDLHLQLSCRKCHRSCRACSDAKPCRSGERAFQTLLLSAVNLAALLLTVALACVVVAYRNNAVMLAGSWPFLVASLCGAALMYASELRWPDAGWNECVASTLLVNVGFAAFYGSLFVKTWRISQLLAPNSLAKVLVDRSLHNGALLARLLVICGLMAAYLAVWMAVDTPEMRVVSGGDDDDVAGNDGGAGGGHDTQAVQCACHHGKFQYGLAAGKLLLMAWGAVLCVRTHRASSRFTEAESMSFAIYLYVAVTAITEALKVVTATTAVHRRRRDTQQLLSTVQIQYTTTLGIALIFLPKLKRTFSSASSSSSTAHRSKSTTSGASQPQATPAPPTPRRRLPAALKKRPSLGKISPSAKTTAPHLFRADSVSLLSLHLDAQARDKEQGTTSLHAHTRLCRSQSLSVPGHTNRIRRPSISSTHSLVLRAPSGSENPAGVAADVNGSKSEPPSPMTRFASFLRRPSWSAACQPHTANSLAVQGAPTACEMQAKEVRHEETGSRHPPLIPRRSSDMSSASFCLPPTLAEDDGETADDDRGFMRRPSDLSMTCSGANYITGMRYDEHGIVRRSSDLSMQSAMSCLSPRTPTGTTPAALNGGSLMGSISGFSRRSSNASEAIVPEGKVLRAAYPHTFSPQLSDVVSLSLGARLFQRNKVTKTKSLERFTRQGSDLSARSLRIAQHATSSLLAQSPTAAAAGTTATTSPPRSIVRSSPAGSVRGSSKQVSFDSSADKQVSFDSLADTAATVKNCT